jgi:nickel/cobalt exporter
MMLMQRVQSLLLALLMTSSAWAHPLGNFSIGQLTELTLAPDGLHLHYVLDLAEMPTFFLRGDLGVSATAPVTDAIAERYRAQAAQGFLNNLAVVLDDVQLNLKPAGGRSQIGEGAAKQPILRMETEALFLWNTLGVHKLHFEDRNFPDRVGWKEVVVRAVGGVKLIESTASSEDRSVGLTRYPDAELQSPPQIRLADMKFKLSDKSALQPSRLDPRVAPELAPAGNARLDPRVAPGSRTTP